MSLQGVEVFSVIKRLIAGTAIVSMASVFALSACSGGSRLTPNVAPQGLFASHGYAPFASQGYSPLFHANGSDTIKSLKWGKMPKGKAGKAFKKPVALSLIALGTNNKPISGAYASPVTLSDGDNLGGTQLLVNGKPASSKNPVTGSTSVITLQYTGLAIDPATLTAKAAGAKAGSAKFSPKLFAIAYGGPKNGGSPEIDLYSTSGNPGFTANFTATEKGWTGKYKKAFTYRFKGISGKTNNCPGAGGAYTVTPASKKPGTNYTVQATNSAGAGECLMTMTGGGGKTLAIKLTFTTSSIGINGRSAP